MIRRHILSLLVLLAFSANAETACLCGVALYGDGEWKTYPDWESSEVLHNGDDYLDCAREEVPVGEVWHV